ncbi:hypothetical protein EVG20_g11141 [Dentipellis fragilis]|uniref:Uncharacterized protein n=1 Tax=Dentipellis fragilis TaxID=205917 RepID=A0A4Y9XN12_9AGAM|nr:hypothetical protein EVG20_g11141 [Dentipellis fragilis]
MAQPSIGSSPDNQGKRQLNITDALNYINAVKKEFKDRPDVYNVFLKTMEDFKKHNIDTSGVISRISTLLAAIPPSSKASASSYPGTTRQPISSPSGEGASMEPRENSGNVTRPPGLKPAIDYLQLLKTRFGPDLYKQFLYIFSSYILSNNNNEVAMSVDSDELFKDAPDVAAAFREFNAAVEGGIVTGPSEPMLEGEKSVVDGLANLSLNA